MCELPVKRKLREEDITLIEFAKRNLLIASER